jgi:hypothetical protein
LTLWPIVLVVAAGAPQAFSAGFPPLRHCNFNALVTRIIGERRLIRKNNNYNMPLPATEILHHFFLTQSSQLDRNRFQFRFYVWETFN